ncbi:MAG: O-antigen ligase family protein [Lachnospiraceae bacterium]|nr:O-antigen ligase family protein [Lachnospiraceae bacterium]
MSKKKSRKIGYRQVFMILFTLFWVIYPFIARVLVKKIPAPEDTFFANTRGLIIDLVQFCKEVALAVFTGGCILYFLGERIFPDRPEKLSKERFKQLRFPIIFIGGYVLFSVLSFLLSDYKETVFFGVNSEYEGLLAILCYVAVFMLALFYMKPQKDGDKKLALTEIFKYGVIAVSVITGILGIIEIFVRPILEFTFVQDLISSEENRTIARSIRNENFIGQISLTFHNPGFLGGFCALITPVCIAISMEGKKIRGVVGSVAAGLLIMDIWWSNSRVALVAIVLTVPAFVVMSVVGLKKKKPALSEAVTPESFGKKGTTNDTQKNVVSDSIRKGLIRRVLVNAGIAVATGVLMIVLSEVLPTYSSRYKEEHSSNITTESVGSVSGKSADNQAGTVISREDSVTDNGMSRITSVGPDGPTVVVFTKLADSGDTTDKTGTTTGSDNTTGTQTYYKYKLTKAEIIDGALYLYSGDTLLKISVDKVFYDQQIVRGEERDFSECLVFSDGKDRIGLDKRIPAVLPATSIRGEKTGFRFSDERYRAVKIALDDRLMYIDLGYSGSVEFYLMEEGIKLIGQGSALLDEIPQPRVTGLESFYSFGTGRGYMWIQSLPLLWESLIVGGGNGTFAFRFRQNEVVGLLNTHGSCKYVIDRPHNWYLQIALSDGVTALICVVALFLWYIIGFIRKHNALGFYDIGLFLGLIGFMLCGMINDSCITANPWFWLLFGCAVTRLVNDVKQQPASKK